ncbi:hypothetical protein [Nostoc sp.]
MKKLGSQRRTPSIQGTVIIPKKSQMTGIKHLSILTREKRWAIAPCLNLD